MTQVIATVAASADDAHDTHNGNFPAYSHTETYFFTGISGGSGGNTICGGCRWTGLGLPSGITITGVSVLLEDIAFSGGNTVVDVGFEDAASPAAFSSGSSPVDRTMTTNRITAHALAASEDPPPGLRTISAQGLIDSLQELVDTYGAIDDLLLLLNDNGSADFNEWRAFDAGTGQFAEITIDYDAGVTNVNLAGSLPAMAGALTAQQTLSRSLAGDLPAMSGGLTVSIDNVNLAGSLPAQAGQLSPVQTLLRTLAGSLPAQTGSLDPRQTLLVTLAGSLPSQGGTLDAQSVLGVSLSGEMPAMSGGLSAQSIVAIDLSGILTAMTGSLSARQFLNAILAGDLPAPAGALSLNAQIALGGSLPAQSGDLAGRQVLNVSLAGDVPAMAGAIQTLLGLAAFKRLTLGERTLILNAVARSFRLNLPER